MATDQGRTTARPASCRFRCFQKRADKGTGPHRLRQFRIRCKSTVPISRGGTIEDSFTHDEEDELDDRSEAVVAKPQATTAAMAALREVMERMGFSARSIPAGERSPAPPGAGQYCDCKWEDSRRLFPANPTPDFSLQNKLPSFRQRQPYGEAFPLERAPHRLRGAPAACHPQ